MIRQVRVADKVHNDKEQDNILPSEKIGVLLLFSHLVPSRNQPTIFK